MPRFNVPVSSVTRTENLAGGEAFTQSPKLELAIHLLTSFAQDQYYRSTDEGIKRLVELVKLVDPSYAAKAAVFARDTFGMRSVTHIVAGELAASVKGQSWTQDFFDKVVVRVDDMTEILSYYTANYGKRPIPNSLKKGLAKAFTKFDAYQLAKYRAEGKALSLVDVVNLCHPSKPKNALRALMDGTLKSTDTWESQLTEAGQGEDEGKEERKADVWEGLIRERKIGYFALLRNLRNILEQAPSIVSEACELLVDETLIRKSRVLPFRFDTALTQIQKMNEDGTRAVVTAISKAFDIACANVPVLPGRTLIALDDSGSMTSNIGKGKPPADIAALFGAVLYKTQPNSDLLLFADRASWFMGNANDSATTIASQIKSVTGSGGGTNFNLIFEAANKAYDRVIILSDMQAWVGRLSPAAAFAQYKREYSANPHVFCWDLQGYGTMEFPEQQVYSLAGFSEKVFDVMGMLEEDRQALVHRIEAVIL